MNNIGSIKSEQGGKTQPIEKMYDARNFALRDAWVFSAANARDGDHGYLDMLASVKAGHIPVECKCLFPEPANCHKVYNEHIIGGGRDWCGKTTFAERFPALDALQKRNGFRQ